MRVRVLRALGMAAALLAAGLLGQTMRAQPSEAPATTPAAVAADVTAEALAPLPDSLAATAPASEEAAEPLPAYFSGVNDPAAAAPTWPDPSGAAAVSGPPLRATGRATCRAL